ncbi:MAG TPA: retroviral-like aspartic protease family protein [Acetobacteraceae bacterium]|nr:retroviral-like aspartic protease family protein [Acetobacteraceae bacterium]
MESRYKAAWIALLACCALAACQGAGSNQPCQIVHLTDLPLTDHDQAFYTTIKINGHDAHMLFDTGAATNLLSAAAARRLGMTVDRIQGLEAVGLGGSREEGIAQSHNVNLGATHGEDLLFETVDSDVDGGKADGILGMNFLHGYDFDLDFWDNRLGLYATLGDCSRPSTALSPPLYGVPFAPPAMGPESQHLEETLSPAIYVTINGERLRALIDTGAVHTTVFRDTARRIGLGKATILGRGKMRGVGPRRVDVDVRMSAPVTIGDLTINNMPVIVADQRHLENADMLLGYDFVTRVHLWISHSSGTLIMQFPPLPTPPPAAPNGADPRTP